MKTLSFVLIAGLLSGCLVNPTVTYPDSTNTTSVVMISIEDSYIGQNIGAKQDIRMLTECLTNVTDDVVVLRNGMATRRNVREAILRACSNELAIVFFTCHGGQEKAYKDALEADGKDEFVYLSDSSMSDNEIWDLFRTSTNRVFALFNCCHAGTMFRTKRLGVAGIQEDVRGDDSSVDMLAWCSSSEDALSRTSYKGGLFVQSLYNTYKAFDGDLTYDTAWSSMMYISDIRKKQNPERHVIGDYSKFKDRKMFR